MKYLLLLIPVMLALAAPVYDMIEPKLFGFPFFYWSQIALIPLCSLFIYLVYRAEPRAR